MSYEILNIYEKLKSNIGKVIVGKDNVKDLLIICLLCKGHMLLEDVPGTAKTMTVKALAKSAALEFRRIQFTPDVLPSDITGINYYNMKNSAFEFIKGPIFANIILADEINRATPKTQSGLLESMEEAQATVDGKTYPLSDPFMVIATQNPIENMGVFPLPEAQLDRFLIKTSVQYPTHDECIKILSRFNDQDPLKDLKAVVSRDEIRLAQSQLEKIYVHPDIMDYIVTVNEAGRNYENVILGPSPRGALALMKVSKGFAAISGRDHVLPDDVKRSAHAVLEHRLILSSSAKLKKNYAYGIIEDILNKTPVPTEAVIRDHR